MEAAGAAFRPPVLQHNNIINSSSNIPSLCHSDEWCSHEPDSGYAAVISVRALCVCVFPFIGKVTCIQGLWNFQPKTPGAPNEVAGNGETALKERDGVKGHHEKLPGFFSGAPGSWSSHQTRPGWMPHLNEVLWICHSNITATPAAPRWCMVRKWDVRLEYSLQSPQQLKGRLTKFYKAHDSRVDSAVCLRHCWSRVNPWKQLILHPVRQMRSTRRQHIGQIYLIGKHMPSCNAALSINKTH